MYRDEKKHFIISLSTDSYMSKDESKNAVGTTMRWSTQTVSMEEMLNYCITGHSYCNLFHDDNGELFTCPFQAFREKNNNHFCFSLSIEDITKKYSKNIAKRKAKERQRLSVENIFSVYDITMSPSENVPYLLIEHNISVSVSTQR